MADEAQYDPLATVHKRIADLAADLAANTKATHANTASIAGLEGSVAAIKENTDSIVSFFRAASGAFTVLGWLGKIAKWVTAIGAAIGLLWAWVHHGPK